MVILDGRVRVVSCSVRGFDEKGEESGKSGCDGERAAQTDII